MTDEEIIELGVQAGIIPWTKHEYIGGNKFSASDEGLDGDRTSLIQFAKLIAQYEREACAKIADEWAVGWPHPSQVIAEQIRSRSETSIRNGT